MADEKKLNDEQLEQVSGGGREYHLDNEVPEHKIRARYEVGFIVKTNRGWILKVVGHTWLDAADCMGYYTEIVKLPSTYHGEWKVGDPYFVHEPDIVEILDIL